MMRLLLVQPLLGQGRPGLYVRSCVVEPLGIEYLAEYVEHRGARVEVRHPLGSVEEFLAAVREVRPNIIGYSVYTYALPEALEWARRAKAELDNVVNVFGGYHPSGDPTVVLSPEVDYVIVGEGEASLAALVGRLAEGRQTDDLAGVVSAHQWSTGKRPRAVRLTVEELASLRPRRSGTLLAGTKHYQLSSPPPTRQRALAQVLLSRGCTHGCRFCTSRTMWPGGLTWRSADDVAEELRDLRDQYGTNLVFFADLCLNSSRGRLLDLCRALQQADLGVSWWGLFRPEGLDAELIQEMSQAGCVKLSVGVNHEVTLDPNWAPSEPVVPDCLRRTLAAAHDLGLIVRGLLMIGLPWETRDYLIGMVEALADVFDELRIAFCCPFPGTALWEEARSRSDVLGRCEWRLMTTDRPVLTNPRLSSEEYESVRRQMIVRFFGSSRYRARIEAKLRTHPHLRDSFDEFLGFLRSRGLGVPSTIGASARTSVDPGARPD
jgi:anaerobic magnesium-protoporphyrin IX monomethyl ester cyclase